MILGLIMKDAENSSRVENIIKHKTRCMFANSLNNCFFFLIISNLLIIKYFESKIN